MTTVILVAHILVSIILVVVVLMQRSEGGALGIGGGGGGGGLMSGRGVAGALVRTTMIFGGLFFVLSLALTYITTHDNRQSQDLAPAAIEAETDDPATPATDDLGVGNITDILDADSALVTNPGDVNTAPSVTPSETPVEQTSPAEEAQPADPETAPQ